MTTRPTIELTFRNSLKFLACNAGATDFHSIEPTWHSLCSGGKSSRNANRAVSEFMDRSYRVVFESVHLLCTLHFEFTASPIFDATRGIYTRNGSEAVPMERQPSPGWVSTPFGRGARRIPGMARFGDQPPRSRLARWPRTRFSKQSRPVVEVGGGSPFP
jgi:hypothetical protein